MHLNKLKPVYLMSGGSGSKKEDRLLKEIFTDIQIQQPVIAYIGSASGDDKTFFKWIEKKMLACGAGKVILAPTVKKKSSLDEAKNILEKSDIVFISGGDVEEGMKIVSSLSLDKFLSSLYQSGKVFMGASAGSIMLCQQWIKWENPDDDSTLSLFDCLNICPIICDTHAEDDEWEELKTLLKTNEQIKKGFGIPTGGVLKYFPDGKMRAMGKNISEFVKNKKGLEERIINQE